MLMIKTSHDFKLWLEAYDQGIEDTYKTLAELLHAGVSKEVLEFVIQKRYEKYKSRE